MLTRREQHVAQLHAAPDGSADRARVPVKPLDRVAAAARRLDRLHLGAPVAGALDGRDDGRVFEHGLEVIDCDLQRAQAVALDL